MSHQKARPPATPEARPLREARLVATREVRLDAIVVGERLRPVTEAAVASIMASIGELGVAMVPIALRQVRHQGNALKLMAGGHRVEVYRRLGFETIRADIWDCTDNWARLAEVDENLANAELSTLELAQFLAERKRVYERLHPEGRHGFKGALKRWDKNADDTVSFASAISGQRGTSVRSIQRLARYGWNLSPAAAEILRGLPKPVTHRDLKALTTGTTPEEMTRAAAHLRDGARSGAEALALVRGRTVGKPPVDKGDDDTASELLARFRRAPMEARRRFLRAAWEQFPKVMSDAAETHQPRDGAGA